MENLNFISLFIIGLSYGATACMFSCMPFLAPLLITNSNSLKDSSRIVIPFSLGRVFTYTLIAVAASSGSLFIKAALNDNRLFQILLGIFTILMAFMMLAGVYKNKKSCTSSNDKYSLKPKGTIGFFTIGALVSLTPCVPVLTLITLSANTGTVLGAVMYGVSFGFGAILVPFIFYTFFVGNIFRGLVEQFRSYTVYIQVFASLLLLFTGAMVLTGKISL